MCQSKSTRGVELFSPRSPSSDGHSVANTPDGLFVTDIEPAAALKIVQEGKELPLNELAALNRRDSLASVLKVTATNDPSDADAGQSARRQGRRSVSCLPRVSGRNSSATRQRL